MIQYIKQRIKVSLLAMKRLTTIDLWTDVCSVGLYYFKFLK